MPGNLLTPDERSRLEKVIGEIGDSRDARIKGLLRHVRVLLLYDDGQATRDVARGAGLSRGRSRYWRRQYQKFVDLVDSGRREIFTIIPVGEQMGTQQRTQATTKVGATR